MNKDIFNTEFWDFCKKMEILSKNEIALRLQKKSLNYDRFSIINQIVGLQIAKTKLPSWYSHKILYPIKLSMEQCSSELTALYKKSIVESGNSMVDLTAGFGIDCAFLSQKYKNTLYNEQNKELTKIAKYNFQILGYNISIENQDASHLLKHIDKQDLIYIDPARRDKEGKKTVRIEDCEPNIIDIENLLFEKSNQILIKLSPMLDIDHALTSLDHVASVHIVSVKNECKELLFLLEANVNTKPVFHCVNIYDEENISIFSFYKEYEKTSRVNFSTKLRKYIYEPNSSILKAGAFKSVAEKYEIEKLHINTHLYTSDYHTDDFHGRIIELIDEIPYHSKNIKELKNKIEKLNISTRNFPLTTEQLKQKLKIKDGGDIYLFGITISNNEKVLLICKKTNFVEN